MFLLPSCLRTGRIKTESLNPSRQSRKRTNPTVPADGRGETEPENCSEPFREVHQLSCQGWSGLSGDAASPPPSQQPCFRHMAGSSSPAPVPSCLRSSAAASRASPCLRPSSDPAEKAPLGLHGTARKGGGGGCRYVEAAGSGGQEAAFCRSSFLWLPDLQGAKHGSWDGKGATLGWPSSPCSLFGVQKSAFSLPLTGKALERGSRHGNPPGLHPRRLRGGGHSP